MIPAIRKQQKRPSFGDPVGAKIALSTGLPRCKICTAVNNKRLRRVQNGIAVTIKDSENEIKGRYGYFPFQGNLTTIR